MWSMILYLLFNINVFFNSQTVNSMANSDFTTSNVDYPNDAFPLVTIKVIFHVLYTTPENNLSDQQLQSQIEVLNQDFGSYSPKGQFFFTDRIYDTNIRFTIQEIIRKQPNVPDYTCDLFDPYLNSYAAYSAAKNPHKFLNIWICPSKNAQGFSQPLAKEPRDNKPPIETITVFSGIAYV